MAADNELELANRNLDGECAAALDCKVDLRDFEDGAAEVQEVVSLETETPAQENSQAVGAAWGQHRRDGSWRYDGSFEDAEETVGYCEVFHAGDGKDLGEWLDRRWKLDL